ncbi:MAG: YebC/PmpR family DNA-binding transcriptional regulator [Candidatus Spechtbacteria bacterium SB0662_bin_43]|uniref:Probable transcriptional regulatory protein F4X82_02750 n=1 Tax=Candidatus Spechtbacteria bacterium SB0662_bin_43 TaxID=2604897 RepID=A0A845DAC9_9BACT|nr:YebC/PmpR family DNA-binding transcriptional regulator [Candidatus Spechtbacteria bacterium SB0662_bin_43]
MSGHSKWSTIKHKKASTDQKRADAFSKIARAITVAARGGGDVETNYELRSVVEKAKNANMPKDNIERAIKKGTGELGGEHLEELLIEAYGPDGVAFLITGVTDNKNRTAAEIRHLLSRYGGKIATEGSVQWLFEQQGVVRIILPPTESKDEFELLAIDQGATDIAWEDTTAFIYTTRDDLQTTQQSLAHQGYTGPASLEWVPKNSVSTSEKTQTTIQKLFEALDDNNDIQDVYTNAE